MQLLPSTGDSWVDVARPSGTEAVQTPPGRPYILRLLALGTPRVLFTAKTRCVETSVKPGPFLSEPKPGAATDPTAPSPLPSLQRFRLCPLPLPVRLSEVLVGGRPLGRPLFIEMWGEYLLHGDASFIVSLPPSRPREPARPPTSWSPRAGEAAPPWRAAGYLSRLRDGRGSPSAR